MIEKIATVTRLDQGKIWLSTKQSSSCSGCGQKSSCMSATIATALPKREFEIDCDIEVKVGDQVIVAINDENLLISAFLLYMLPLLMMLTGSFVVISIFPYVDIEIWLPAIALSVLLTTFWTIHRYQPEILFYFYLKPQLIGKI